MRKETTEDRIFSEVAQERERAQRVLSELQQLEQDNKYRVYTIVFENGTTISNTNINKLNEFESRYARQGVRVAKRY